MDNMKYAFTKIDYRSAFTEECKSLMNCVMSRFNIPERGVYVLFNDEEIDRKSNYDETCYLPCYHTNISSGKKGMGINLAPVVSQIIASDKYSNLVFISKQVCERDDIELCWCLTHELTHLEQDLISHDLSVANDFLCHIFSIIKTDEPKVSLSIPFELDAQLKTWRVVREVFGEQEADCFVEAKSKTTQGKHLFKYLVKKDLQLRYDLIGETVKMLRKYQDDIQNARTAKQDKWKEWIEQFDIDQYCESLTKVARLRKQRDSAP